MDNLKVQLEYREEILILFRATLFCLSIAMVVTGVIIFNQRKRGNMLKEYQHDFGWINAMDSDKYAEFEKGLSYHKEDMTKYEGEHRPLINFSNMNHTHFKCSCGLEYHINHSG